jgi:hypothetical protein
MRIKSDFVTNSSSTAYIVCVPRDFRPTIEEIKKAYIHHDDEYDDVESLTDDDIYHKLPDEYFDTIKDGDNLWYYGTDGADSRLYSMVAEICENNGFVIAVFDIGGEGNNRIQGIKEEDMQKWFLDTQLKKLEIEVTK